MIELALEGSGDNGAIVSSSQGCFFPKLSRVGRSVESAPWSFPGARDLLEI